MLVVHNPSVPVKVLHLPLVSLHIVYASVAVFVSIAPEVGSEHYNAVNV